LSGGFACFPHFACVYLGLCVCAAGCDYFQAIYFNSSHFRGPEICQRQRQSHQLNAKVPAIPPEPLTPLNPSRHPVNLCHAHPTTHQNVGSAWVIPFLLTAIIISIIIIINIIAAALLAFRWHSTHVCMWTVIFQDFAFRTLTVVIAVLLKFWVKAN